MTLRIEQSSTYKGEDWWEWSVWVEGTPAELDSLEAVTYHLDPTFPDPVRRVTDPADKFRLDSASWGTFTIKADLHRKDGQSLRRSHDLRLEPAPDMKATPKSSAVSDEERRPRVFLSSAAVNRHAAFGLGRALQARGIEVVDDRKLDASLPWQRWITEELRSCDAVVAMISDVASEFAEAQIKTAQSMDVPVLPVVVGRTQRLPEPLYEEEEVLRLEYPDRPQRVADRLVERVHSLAQER